MTQPLVSVLITVFNGMPFLKDCVDGILKQSYVNWELIIVNDQSTDGTLAYLQSLNDKRVQVFSDGKLGRGKALNFGLSKCNGKYVAINDADDVSLPQRLEQQVAFMEANPDFGLVGANFYKVFSEENRELSNKPLIDPELRIGLSKHSCIQHSCVMFRKTVLDQIGGYNLAINFLYDRDIYIRVAEVSKIGNLAEPLVQIFRHGNQFFASRYIGYQRKTRALECGYLAISKLKLPKYYYVLRTMDFVYQSIFEIGRNLLSKLK